jgi:hypothetical protein
MTYGYTAHTYTLLHVHPEEMYGLPCADFHETLWCLHIFCTDFYARALYNVEDTGKPPFTPSSKVWQPMSGFSRNSHQPTALWLNILYRILSKWSEAATLCHHVQANPGAHQVQCGVPAALSLEQGVAAWSYSSTWLVPTSEIHGALHRLTHISS